jgi:hypothetical protein
MPNPQRQQIQENEQASEPEEPKTPQRPSEPPNELVREEIRLPREQVSGQG